MESESAALFLRPYIGGKHHDVPPGASKGKDTRYVDIHERDELDEAQVANWVKQAAALPGFSRASP